MSKKTFNFEKTLSHLEQILNQISSPDISLEDSLSLYKESLQKYSDCIEYLTQVDKEMVVLKNKQDLLTNQITLQETEPLKDSF